MAGWTMRRRAALLGLADGLAMLAAGAALRPRHARAQGSGSLDPEVAAALRRMSATLAAAPSLTVTLTQLREAPAHGDASRMLMLGATVAVGLQRPGRLAALVGSDRGSFRLWFDGSRATLLDLRANAYARAEIRGGIEDALEALEARLQVDIPLRDLLAADPYAALVDPGTSGFRVGSTFVDGVACEHFALRNREVDWQIWLPAEGPPLPRRLVVVERAASGAPRTILEFQHWNLQPGLDPAVFAFAAPDGTAEVAWLQQPTRTR